MSATAFKSSQDLSVLTTYLHMLPLRGAGGKREGERAPLSFLTAKLGQALHDGVRERVAGGGREREREAEILFVSLFFLPCVPFVLREHVCVTNERSDSNSEERKEHAKKNKYVHTIHSVHHTRRKIIK